jgi:hypothetical protein
VKAVGEFLRGDDRVLVCTHATFRFTVDELGVEAFDERLIAVDEFHHVSANQDNRLGAHLSAFIARDKAHVVYKILAKSMSEQSLRHVAEIIAGRKVNLSLDEARDLARRALKFKQERGRLPSITSQDAWEKRMAEGVAFLARKKAEADRG